MINNHQAKGIKGSKRIVLFIYINTEPYNISYNIYMNELKEERKLLIRKKVRASLRFVAHVECI